MADRKALLAIAIVAALGLVLGWHTLWFLTDDAFIAFRYVSNGMHGHGYVWNPPPYRPVDGYTSFSWVVLLEWTWRVTGVEPPKSANVLSLLFAFGQLFLMFRMILGLRLRNEALRLPLLAVAVLGVLTNRTFLAWTSSGLETAMFNFAVLLWVYLAGWRGAKTARDCAYLTAAAVLVALTRPDGLLYVAATGAFFLVDAFTSGEDRTRAVAPAFAGLGALAIFVGWRVGTYGFVLPNTYYAKVVKARPELGIRYLGSFVLEYALWLWVIVVVVAAVIWIRTRPWGGAWSIARASRVLVALVPAAAVLGHAGYYTAIVGGDHFEYRVYSQLVPLIWVVMVWAVDRINLSRMRTLGVTVGLLLLSWPLPWLHYVHTQDLDTRGETVAMKYPVAPHLPGPVRWYGEWFDAMQFHLISFMTCMRHEEHRTFYEHKIEVLPPREQGETISGDDMPVHVSGEVGYVGWVLPNVAIIDAFGLNDYYVARNNETVQQLTAHAPDPAAGLHRGVPQQREGRRRAVGRAPPGQAADQPGGPGHPAHVRRLARQRPTPHVTSPPRPRARLRFCWGNDPCSLASAWPCQGQRSEPRARATTGPCGLRWLPWLSSSQPAAPTRGQHRRRSRSTPVTGSAAGQRRSDRTSRCWRRLSRTASGGSSSRSSAVPTNRRTYPPCRSSTTPRSRASSRSAPAAPTCTAARSACRTGRSSGTSSAPRNRCSPALTSPPATARATWRGATSSSRWRSSRPAKCAASTCRPPRSWRGSAWPPAPARRSTAPASPPTTAAAPGCPSRSRSSSRRPT